MFYFWGEVGQRMHIGEIPQEYAQFEQYNRAYERSHFGESAGGQRVADATIRMFTSWAPRPLRSCVSPVMRALMDDSLMRALGLAPAPRFLKSVLAVGLRLRGRVAHVLNPGPVLRTETKHRSYPSGYKIEAVGPIANSER